MEDDQTRFVSEAVRVRPGPHQELAELYAAHASGALRLAYLLTDDFHAAEDIANEAFVRISSRFVRLQRPDQFSSYLYRTVTNLSRSHGRKQRREASHQRLFVQGNLEIPDLPAREALWRALLSLPIRQRTAVFLRFYEDLSEAQAADVLGCSVSAIKSLTFRAMEALRKELDNE